MEQPNYYAIIPANVRYCKELKPMEKLIYGELTCLSNSYGFCNARNGYFAELYDVDEKTVSRWISHLQKCGFIRVELIKGNDNSIKERRIFIVGDEKVTTSPQKNHYPSDEKVTTPSDLKVTDNNTSINNTSLNIYIPNNTENETEETKQKKSRKKAEFTPPTLEDVKNYCELRQNKVNPEEFYKYYSDFDWKDSNGRPVKDWKRKLVCVWEKNNFTRTSSTGSGSKYKSMINDAVTEAQMDIKF